MCTIRAEEQKLGLLVQIDETLLNARALSRDEKVYDRLFTLY